jgi:hypothetical protein
MRFVDEGDGNGELIAHAATDCYSGTSPAYFNINEIEEFATAIAAFQPTSEARPVIACGFIALDHSGEPAQELLGISVYPIDLRGHVGIQVRLATPFHGGDRPESRAPVNIELLTTYEPLTRFGRELIAVLRGNAEEAALVAEM